MPLEVLGGVVLIGSVVVGSWAVAKMGWARLLFAGPCFHRELWLRRMMFRND